jgi:hypothetical protein
MSTKSRTLPFVCALVTLFASHARAQEYTFTYEGTVSTADVGSVASVGDKLRITFTFDVQDQGTPNFTGGTRHRLTAATGRAGTKSWSFDNTFVDIMNDYPTETGFRDEYKVFLGGAGFSSFPDFELHLASEGATRPPGGPSFNLFQPDPSTFQLKSLTVRNFNAFTGSHTAIANSTVAVVPTCYVHQNLKMTGHALTVEYGHNFSEAVTLNLVLMSHSATVRLASVQLGPIAHTQFNVPIPDLPILGVVGLMTTITTDLRGIACWDFDIIDTGQPSP